MLGAELYQWPLANGEDPSRAFRGFPVDRDRKWMSWELLAGARSTIARHLGHLGGLLAPKS